MSTCAIVSFRLGLTDGVSIVAETWRRALMDLGYEVVTVAGEGPVDRTVAGLALDAAAPPSISELEHVLADVDLVVVENLLTIPLNLAASRHLAQALRDRPAILHHHDPAWQRAELAHLTDLPPVDPEWRHVVINDLTREEFSARGIPSTRIYNGFDPDPRPGDRRATRAQLGVAEDEILLVHPVRAIERKGIPEAVTLCEQLGATYWLLGPAEEGYEAKLDSILAEARCRVVRNRSFSPSDFYAASDAVVFPSTWEGFGNPPIEAAVHGRPAAVAPYPVAEELRALGFRWFPTDDPDPLARFLRSPDPAVIEHNRNVVRQHLSLDVMVHEIGRLLDDAGWKP